MRRDLAFAFLIAVAGALVLLWATQHRVEAAPAVDAQSAYSEVAAPIHGVPCVTDPTPKRPLIVFTAAPKPARRAAPCVLETPGPAANAERTA